MTKTTALKPFVRTQNLLLLYTVNSFDIHMQFYPLRLWPENSNFNFMLLSKLAYFISIVLTVLSLSCLMIYKLNLGIDFKGGIAIDVKIAPQVAISKVRQTLTALDLGEIVIQATNANEMSIKVSSPKSKDEVVETIKSSLTRNLPEAQIEYRQIDFVGPQVGQQLIWDGAKSIIFAFLAIMVYVWSRFEWQFGAGVIISLVHDAILCVGFMSVTQLDFNLSSIAAILTVIGYSVNDSVVIYDRIRENLKTNDTSSISQIINISINQTLSRTTLTVFTTLVANLALIVYGGPALSSFSKLVFFGIVAGTYSSIFVSAPILTFLRLEQLKKER